MREVGIGLAGFGTVGTGVYLNLGKNRALLRERLGCDLVVRKIAVRDTARKRQVPLPLELVVPDWRNLLDHPSIDVVVELMGGIDEPRKMILESINRGKMVVTANKALLAEHGAEIFALATEKRVPVFYEAAVAGGIPIIKSVKEAFVANHFQRLRGIVNGTSNYILTRMAESGMDFASALREAQEAGYAEADPALDVNGWDAGHKAIILASLAYGFWVPAKDVLVQGIEKITPDDMRFASQLGYTIKLLAVIDACADGSVEVSVQPSLVPNENILASVRGVFNAVAVRGDVVGDTLFYGRGAGQDPTASSVIGDLADAAHTLMSPPSSYGFIPHGLYGKLRPSDETVSPFYLRLGVDDKPGVLARIAGVLGDAGIGISSVIQPETHDNGHAALVLMIHDAPRGRMLAALGKIRALDCVHDEPALYRVEAAG
ncbi:MAG: homoserine dehydrogenase [Chthoniobacterales bacterium]|nr:homoserine dehydrogenase [Chthoniobacterales bacterium]